MISQPAATSPTSHSHGEEEPPLTVSIGDSTPSVYTPSLAPNHSLGEYSIVSEKEVKHVGSKIEIDSFINKQGQSLLLELICCNQLVEFKHLIENTSVYCFDINKMDRIGNTPLHVAASKMEVNTSFIRLLIKSGARIEGNPEGLIGLTPLQCAIQAGNLDAARILIDAGANTSAGRSTLLHDAAHSGSCETVRFVLDMCPMIAIDTLNFGG